MRVGWAKRSVPTATLSGGHGAKSAPLPTTTELTGGHASLCPPYKKQPHREVVWVILIDFDRCLLLLLPLWACGQRFFSVVHMSTAMTWGCRWFGRPDLMVVGRERAVRQFRNLAAL